MPYTPTASQDQSWFFALRSRLVPIDDITPFSPREDIDTAQHLVTAELEALRLLTSVAKRRLNDLTITAKLPVEVLQRVFSSCAANDLAAPWPKPGEMAMASVIALSQVCHRWRLCALQTHELWAHLHSALGVDWLPEMVARAQSVPLHLKLDNECRNPDAMRDQMRQLLPRLQSVSLRGTMAPTESMEAALYTYVRLLSSPMPILQSLEIDHTVDHALFVHLPAELFAGCAPQLRRLVLVGDLFMWPNQIQRMEQLTHLELDCMVNIFMSIANIGDMLANNMPNLQVLTLKRTATIRERWLDFRTAHRHLLRLTDVNLEGSGIFLSNLLPQFCITPATNVTITCLGSTVGDMEPLSTALRVWVEDGMDGVASLEARISFCRHYDSPATEYDIWELRRLADGYDTPDPVLGMGQGQGRFRIRAKARYDPLKEHLLSSVLIQCGLRALTMSGSERGRGHQPRWQKLFEGCTTVEHLCITETEWLARLLREWRTDGSIFPALVSLWIRGVDLTQGVDVPGAVVYRDSVPWTPRMVLERLVAQQRSSFPLGALYLTESTVPGGWVEELSQVVTVRVGHRHSP